MVCLTFAESRYIAFASDELCFASSSSFVDFEAGLAELEVGEVELPKDESNCSFSGLQRVPDPASIISDRQVVSGGAG